MQARRRLAARDLVDGQAGRCPRAGKIRGARSRGSAIESERGIAHEGHAVDFGEVDVVLAKVFDRVQSQHAILGVDSEFPREQIAASPRQIGVGQFTPGGHNRRLPLRPRWSREGDDVGTVPSRRNVDLGIAVVGAQLDELPPSPLSLVAELPARALGHL